MWNNKKPSKYILLAALIALIALAFLIMFGLRAQARESRFLPIREVTTPAGLTVWLLEDHTLPIVAMRFAFVGAGAALDPQDKQGLSRMLSNTMDEGAGGMDSQTFQKALSDSSISLSFDSSRDTFGGKLVMLNRHKEKAFKLLSLAVTAPRFDAEPVARMRDGNLSRIRSSMSEPDWMAARLVNDRAFEGHPYAMNSGGTLSSLAAITPDDLRAFHKNNLTRDRLVIAIAGDITADEAAAVDSIFAKLPATGEAVPTKDTALKNTGKTYLYNEDIPQSFIEVMLPAFGREDKDFYALQVLNYIYGGAGFGSRLMEEVREKRGLTYGIYSSVQDFDHADALNVSVSTKNESAGEVLDIIRTEMTKMRGAPVTDKELKDAKSYITGSMPLALNSTEAIAAIMLSLQVDGLPSTYLDGFADKIRAVTAADITRAADRVLIPADMLTILVGKPQNIENTEIVKELPNVR